MLLINFSSLILMSTTLVNGRGPHHPRGEQVKHHHVHYQPTKDAKEKLTQDQELLHDIEHIKEHLDESEEAPDLSQMSNEELEFYYFQVHDTDKNSKLDGLEILQAISHIVHSEDENETEDELDAYEMQDQKSKSNFDYYIELIDQVLQEDDSDGDGYLSYPEYVSGRKKSPNGPNQDIYNPPMVQMIP